MTLLEQAWPSRVTVPQGNPVKVLRANIHLKDEPEHEEYPENVSRLELRKLKEKAAKRAQLRAIHYLGFF